MRRIYLSPHLDDAVLSAGGLIYEQTHSGTPVEIWTFMCGFPDEGELSDLARALHMLWGARSATEAVRLRRAEDQRAAAILGARAVHFDFLDCIYRRGREGQPLYTNIFDAPNPAEADLPAQIAQTMVAWLQKDDRLVCPLAVDGHVDHVLVRRAAEMLQHPLDYVADLPYTFQNPDGLTPKTTGMHAVLCPVSEAGLRSWLEAAEAYTSQIESLFGNVQAMREQIQAYWAGAGGVRLWRSGPAGLDSHPKP